MASFVSYTEKAAASSSSSWSPDSAATSSTKRAPTLPPVTSHDGDKLQHIAQLFQGKIVAGPMLNFRGQRPKEGLWPVSMMLVTQGDSVKTATPPVRLMSQPDKLVPPSGCMELRGHYFYRYNFPIRQGSREQQVAYTVDKQMRDFFVPAIGQPARMMFFSCNGYQTEADKAAVGGIEPMWSHARKLHRKAPFHYMVGGGDTLYADGIIGGEETSPKDNEYGKAGVFAIPTIAKWLAIKDDDEREAHPFTKAMAEEVSAFFLRHYCHHFSQPEFGDALAEVPSMMTWDDHDIFDGYGSHKPELNNSPVFQGIFGIALQYYLLFQQQAGIGESRDLHLFGDKGYNFLRLADDGKVAVLCVDTRSERKVDQIVSPESWKQIFERLDALEGCEHLKVVFSVPLVYPSLRTLEKVFDIADDNPLAGWFLSKLPGMKNTQLREWELKDDAGDHWGAEPHLPERNAMIMRFQELAKAKKLRITFFGGDVHCGGAGKMLEERPTLPKECDPLTMWQIISSGIGNVPPPRGVVTLVRGLGLKRERIGDTATVMRLTSMKREDDPSDKPTLVWRRNFATAKRDIGDGKLNVRLHVERNPEGKHADEDPKVYCVTVPAVRDPALRPPAPINTGTACVLL